MHDDGPRFVGKSLFSGTDLYSALLSQAQRTAERAIPDWLIHTKRPSKLALVRHVSAKVEFRKPVALQVLSFEPIEADRFGISMRATIGYTGDPALFFLSITSGPPERSLIAHVKPREITIKVRASQDWQPGLMPLLLSEIEAIQQQLSMQTLDIERYNKDILIAVRNTVRENFDKWLTTVPILRSRNTLIRDAKNREMADEALKQMGYTKDRLNDMFAKDDRKSIDRFAKKLTKFLG